MTQGNHDRLGEVSGLALWAATTRRGHSTQRLRARPSRERRTSQFANEVDVACPSDSPESSLLRTKSRWTLRLRRSDVMPRPEDAVDLADPDCAPPQPRRCRTAVIFLPNGANGHVTVGRLLRRPRPDALIPAGRGRHQRPGRHRHCEPQGSSRIRFTARLACHYDPGVRQGSLSARQRRAEAPVFFTLDNTGPLNRGGAGVPAKGVIGPGRRRASTTCRACGRTATSTCTCSSISTPAARLAQPANSGSGTRTTPSNSRASRACSASRSASGSSS